MLAWNAEPAAAIARPAPLLYKAGSAALRPLSIRFWEDREANAAAVLNPVRPQLQNGEAAAAEGDGVAGVSFMKYLILAALWIIFCALHSALISVTFTQFIKRKLGDTYRYFRLFYNIFAVVTLLPAVIYSLSIRQEPFSIWAGYLKPVQYLLFLTGVVCFVMGAKRYSLAQLSGLAQIREGRNNKLISKTGKLSCRGILGVVRHPFYAGIYPLLWSGDLDVTMLIVNIILSIYVFIGTLLEEHKLILEFGDAYRQYQKQVSMLFPFLWIRKKLGFVTA